ncbi:stage V sporulation protein B [Domibacillus epiphyticus]|uniref:Stage V sporulation protein B n=1 Tax=Domibacillus epiphyticus TaxID=1714355 RepID=A0A1V2A989_9BACI|nr:stage V sporulation protein B [Domibacillus epiphyticus]OMP67569.1 stage V sporulation protein B [Domibacillus epiphyticus]
MSSFIKGTMWLAGAIFLVKILGFVNRMIIARLIGEEGVGLYMAVFPAFILTVTAVQFGLPVAVTRSIAAAENDQQRKHIFISSLFFTLTLAAVFTPLLIVIAPYLAETLFQDRRAVYPLYAIAPSVPIIAISSILRGYLHGKMNMKPAALSQLIEQIVRIGLIIVSGRMLLPYGIEYAAAGAMAAASAGELASLMYLLLSFRFEWRKIRKWPGKRTNRQLTTELAETALPAVGSRLIGSGAWFLEPIVVVKSLAIAGITAGAAMKEYGVLTGYALPLMFLPSFLTLALSSSLVPDISESYSKKQYSAIAWRINESLRFCFSSGGLAVIVLFLFSEQLMAVMYHTEKGAGLIQFMAPFFLLYYCQGPLQAVLQALNLSRAAMMNSFFGAAVKLCVIYLFARLPQFGITGAAIGIAVSIVLVTLLHTASMLKAVPMKLQYGLYVKMALLLVFTYFAVKSAMPFLAAAPVPYLLSGIVFCFIVYMFGAIALGIFKKNDISTLLFWRS